MNVKVSSAERRAASVIHYLGQFLPSAHAASTLLSAPPNWSSVSKGVSGPWIAPNTQTAACSLTDIFLLQHIELHLSAPQTVPCSTVTYLLYFLYIYNWFKSLSRHTLVFKVGVHLAFHSHALVDRYSENMLVFFLLQHYFGLQCVFVWLYLLSNIR